MSAPAQAGGRPQALAAAISSAAGTCAYTYVNHTFTSHLALSASLQPFAASEADAICEYPVEPCQLALDITVEHIMPDADGRVHLPDGPGLGVTPNLAGIAPYLVDVEIRVRGKTLYRTPAL